MRVKAVLILATATVLAGCTALNKVPGVNQLPGVKEAVVQRATEEMFAHIEDATLRKHMAAQANKTEFRTRSTSSGRGEEMVQVNEMELKGEDFSMSTWEEKEGAKSNEMIMMGETTYLKDYKDNKWWKQTAEPATETGEETEEAVQRPVDFKEMYQEAEVTMSYEKLGEEACGTLTCFKYREVDSANPEGTRLFWFDTKDYLLRREENKWGEFESVTEYAYDGIEIKAPSPTKDVPEGKSIYEYMVYDGAGLTGEQNQELEKAQEELRQMQEDVGAGEAPETWVPEDVAE